MDARAKLEAEDAEREKKAALHQAAAEAEAGADDVHNPKAHGLLASIVEHAPNLSVDRLALAAFISPFRSDRAMARRLVGEDQLLEIFVDAPLEVCIARDPKGLYARAISGNLKNFTGIDSRYEAPERPELTLRTAERTAEELADVVVGHLTRGGYLG